jgi:hypothetical protein
VDYDLEYYKNEAIIPTGETLEQGPDVKNEIILDPPILALKIKIFPIEYISTVSNSICVRFDVLAADYGINSLKIGCESFQTPGTREWISTPEVSNSHTDKAFMVASKSITEVLAYTSNS